MKKLSVFVSILTLALSFVSADFNRLSIPDSTEIRKAAAESWFYDDLTDLREKHKELRKNALGQEFQIRMEETDDSFAVVIAPQMKMEMDLFTENGTERRVVDEYPGDACGSWLLIRNSVTGKPEKIRIFFSNNSEIYVQFSPLGTKTVADYVVAGLYASRAVPVGIPFEQLYTASIQQILLSTENILPWKYADTRKGQFASKLQMIGVIRKNLKRIVYMPDSMYDEDGKPVYISTGKPRDSEVSVQIENPLTLDQAGFLKWIVDGLVYPVAGSRLYRNPLIVRTVEYNELGLKGVLSRTQELSFTLDWCRNLAAACLSVKAQRNYMWYDACTDVQIEPFSAEVTDKGITQTAGYLKNSGYEISKLKPLLYVLASTEPTYCYLAAIKSPVKDSKNPEHFTFNDCAVIFPLYNDDGQFNCVIFDNGQELNLSQFTAKYKGCFVHLSRILTETSFYPD
jgi:hypothetical protein